MGRRTPLARVRYAAAASVHQSSSETPRIDGRARHGCESREPEDGSARKSSRYLRG